MRVLRCFADRARAQHDDGNTGKNVAVLHPVEDDEAIAHRQAEIRNNQGLDAPY
jgi:hypothetical protein